MPQPSVVQPELFTQLERRFGVRFDAQMLVTSTRSTGPTIGATPTEVYAWVTRTLADANLPLPEDGWPRVQDCVTRAALDASTATGSFKVGAL